ncbi:MAG: geranyl transferase, partial [Armatimonadota bacterium]
MLAREVLKRDAQRIEEYLPTCLPEADPRAQDLGPAIRHSVKGGKRIRGVLVMRSASTFGLEAETVMRAACAFEMLHAAT